MIDIYFATKRLSISAEPTIGYEIEFNPSRHPDREEIILLLEHHPHVTFRYHDEQVCYQAIVALFVIVEAAGGVVRNDHDEVLMIYRHGRYDLPKGHWERGETIEECAVREVEEETGIENISLGNKVCETLHAYYMHQRWELKRTHWYAMQSSYDKPLTPQTEEGVERAEWCDINKLESLTEGSFPTIQSVLSAWALMCR